MQLFLKGKDYSYLGTSLFGGLDVILKEGKDKGENDNDMRLRKSRYAFMYFLLSNHDFYDFFVL